MQLEINKSHKKIDKSNVQDPLKKISTLVAGVVVSASIFNGAIIYTDSYSNDYKKQGVKEIEKITKTSLNEEIHIPKTLTSCVKECCDNNAITKENIENMKDLWLWVDKVLTKPLIVLYTLLISANLIFWPINFRYGRKRSK